ncbi:MAG: AI-2E family transporter [bacterium]
MFIASFLLLFIFIIARYFSVLMPFIFGAGIAYIITPLVEILERRNIPRFLAILIILLPLVAIVPLVIFLLTINLINELKFLFEKIPEFISRGKLFIDVLAAKLSTIGININQENIVDAIGTYLGAITSGLYQTILQIGQGIREIVIIIYNFILIPITTFLLLADREKIALLFWNLVPPNERDKFRTFILKINISFSRYFRGTIILMILVGFIIGFLLWLLGIRYYVFLGIIAAVFNLIPNVGFVLSLAFALLVGALTPPPILSILKISLVYVGEQLLENFLLGPIIISRVSRLNPVMVILAFVLGGSLAGIWGIIFAIPAIIFLRA